MRLILALLLLIAASFDAAARNSEQRVWIFEPANGVVTEAAGLWDNTIVQNVGSVTPTAVVDPITASGNVIEFVGGAIDGTTVGKSLLSKYFPKAPKGSRIVIQFDLYALTQPATNIIILDVECRSCDTTSPGVRLRLNADVYGIERSKIGLSNANTAIASPATWHNVKYELTLGDAVSGYNKLTFDNVYDAVNAPAAFLTNMPIASQVSWAGVLDSEGVDAIQIGMTANSAAAARTVYVKNFSIRVYYPEGWGG